MRTMGGASVGAPTHITITQAHSPTVMSHTAPVHEPIPSIIPTIEGQDFFLAIASEAL